MTKEARAFFAALPNTLLVTVLTAVAFEAIFYLMTLWGESQLELFGVLSAAWISTHEWIPMGVATGLGLPVAGYLGWKFLQMANEAELELLKN